MLRIKGRMHSLKKSLLILDNETSNNIQYVLLLNEA